ncbi:MAG TPA: LLM class flavin-dependent oxidoreductase [Bryobacteraceae bacterium]|nr:LLM class flavin-dependent oxidoreductase [Bryobacteraceae bacterium]
MSARKPVRYSILDLAPVKAGGDIAESFRNSLELAQNAEQWGYTRFWLAEHHSMPGIASAATSILIAHVAAGTRHIRVGSGGIMLPNHAPLVIAEQFGTLETLFPGRIDLGIGRAPGSDGFTARALRRSLRQTGDDLPDLLQELLGYLAPAQPGQHVTAVPGAGTNVPVWLLGSSTFSAQLAARMGLPFAFASHFAPELLGQAIRLYREQYRPSELHPTPYVAAGVPLIAAPTDQEAAYLSTSPKQRFLKLIRGEPIYSVPPVESMDGLWNAAEQEVVESKLGAAIVGGPSAIREGIESFLASTGVDELILTADIYNQALRLRSFQLAAEAIQAHNRDAGL